MPSFNCLTVVLLLLLVAVTVSAKSGTEAKKKVEIGVICHCKCNNSHHSPMKKPCPSSFTQTKGMCIKVFKEKKLRSDAQKICRGLSSFLVWFENEQEHKAVNDFVKKTGIQFYYTGLTGSGASKKWTSGSKSTYRGSKIINSIKSQFGGSVRHTEFYGISGTYPLPFVCRHK